MRYVRHMGFDQARARDILQDAFVRAYRHLGRCGDPDRFDGWLFRITANLCRTAGRRASRRSMTDLDSVTLQEEGPGPDERAERVSLRNRLKERLGRLPDDQREALVLFYLEERPVREIADFTGASESAIKMRLKRGRERLREELRFMDDEVNER